MTRDRWIDRQMIDKCRLWLEEASWARGHWNAAMANHAEQRADTSRAGAKDRSGLHRPLPMIR